MSRKHEFSAADLHYYDLVWRIRKRHRVGHDRAVERARPIYERAKAAACRMERIGAIYVVDRSIPSRYHLMEYRIGSTVVGKVTNFGLTSGAFNVHSMAFLDPATVNSDQLALAARFHSLKVTQAFVWYFLGTPALLAGLTPVVARSHIGGEW